ncbi:MAG: hypothetical protein COZ29_00310 [Candidatus Moranbacteria bacterium CG_4_10_14_3_um_filter_45_9]|nr:MAG: hypothetical protein COZ29_00310 [Candidatus Moranbacteria bacterium CG_4_10_14_3_um_filter_45_9]PJA85838.1 MAG: hypothetical protein CO143_00750 [Candidatus Moranbacteria bacterium CG_4_9_14_3_um_filter_45_14]
MENFTLYLSEKILYLKKNGVLTISYALLTEALFIGYLAFIALFTLEMLLPTFVTVRLNLTTFFFILFSFSFVLAFLGHILNLTFDQKIQKKNPLVWIGLFWTIGILILSLPHFPPLLIPFIIITFLLIGYLFWKIFFDERDEKLV